MAEGTMIKINDDYAIKVEGLQYSIYKWAATREVPDWAPVESYHSTITSLFTTLRDRGFSPPPELEGLVDAYNDWGAQLMEAARKMDEYIHKGGR